MTAEDIARSPLSFNGVEIRDRSEMLSLTDMWRAQGADPAQQPANWLASTEARNFIEILNPGNSGIITKKGRGGGTYAHWQIGLAYAKYLSPEFHIWCNTVVRERMEGKSASLDLSAIKNEIGRQTAAIIDDKLAAFVTKVLPSAVAGYVAEHNLAIADGMTSGEVCRMSMVTQSYPRGISGRVSRRLTAICRNRGITTPTTRIGRVRAMLFPPSMVREWLDAEGRALITRWVEERRGQGRLRLVDPK